MSEDSSKTKRRATQPKSGTSDSEQVETAATDRKAGFGTRKSYREPVERLGLSLFGDDDRRAEVDTAFEAFKRVCEQDGGPVGLASPERFEAAFSDFAKLWRSYGDGRKTEERAARAHVKPEFVALGEQIDRLRSALSSLDGNLNLRRYLTDGLERQIGMPAQASRQGAKALIERVADDLDTLSRVCQSEAELQHQPGERENTTLVMACEAIRQLILDHGGVRVPKSIELADTKSFENVTVEVLYRLIRCVDPMLKPEPVRTALKKLPPLPKAAKIPN